MTSAAREMVAEGIAAILPHARQSRMPLAIEPLHPMYAADRACINTLEQALDVCDLLGEGVGVAIDVYHVWWDPKLYTQIARAGSSGRILAHHICDWLVPTRDLLLDRGMMGDGVIDLKSIRGAIERSGYRGPQEVEIFSSENWWKRRGEEVIATCAERFLTLLSLRALLQEDGPMSFESSNPTTGELLGTYPEHTRTMLIPSQAAWDGWKQLVADAAF